MVVECSNQADIADHTGPNQADIVGRIYPVEISYHTLVGTEGRTQVENADHMLDPIWDHIFERDRIQVDNVDHIRADNGDRIRADNVDRIRAGIQVDNEDQIFDRMIGPMFDPILVGSEDRIFPVGT